jgi:hypothetical protein
MTIDSTIEAVDISAITVIVGTITVITLSLVLTIEIS